MPKVSAVYEETRRQQIVQAAARCFGRKGYQASTIEDVCREANISKGGLYTYFRSKEQLFAEVCSAEWMEGLREMGAAIDAPIPVEAKLEALGERAFHQLGATDESWEQVALMSLAIWNEAARSEETRALVLTSYEQWKQTLVALLREGQANGELAMDFDPEMLAIVLMAAFDGLLVQRAVGGQPLDREKASETLVRMVKKGILFK